MTKFLCTLSLVGIASFVAGCGSATEKLSCTDDKGCLAIAGSLFQGDADTIFTPICCGGICLLPNAGGCDSGWRYLTDEPGYGHCVPDDEVAMCTLPTHDLAMQPQEVMDMSMPPSGDAGDM